MAENLIYIPYINPVKMVEVSPAQLAKYFTKHFDEYAFRDRLHYWQQPEDFTQIWQVDDIIYMQFHATFDPIVVQLVDKYGNAQITLPALIGLPNKFLANTYSFQFEMSLADVPTGCYWLKFTAGTGDERKYFISAFKQHVSEEAIEESVCLEYWHDRFHEDVMFERGIKFQRRMMGHLGFLQPGQNSERYKDQLFNPTVLSSRTFRQFPAVFGDANGLTDDDIDLLNRLWTCKNVLWDGKPMGVVDGKFEFIEVNHYPKRGVKLLLEEGINRRSSVFAMETDTRKQLMATIIVGAKVWGDMANNGSSNAVPIRNIE